MAPRRTIDLNADVGEDVVPGIDDALMHVVTSVNIACGGHAGDEVTMRDRSRLAAELGIRIGAHPSYPDRENFGRVSLRISPAFLVDHLRQQIEELQEIASRAGAEVAYFKPHGALYNDVGKMPEVAEAVYEASDRLSLPVMLLPHAKRPGFRVLVEGFIDRAYLPDGTLVPRSHTSALVLDPELAAAQALELAGRVDSLCVHSDTPGALEIVKAARRRLEQDGFIIGA